GSDPFTSISGALDVEGDVDVYAINVCDPASFSATTYTGDDNALDTRLYLFDANGAGVTFNDDVPDGFPGDQSLTSRISGQFVPAAGQYYLAITTYNSLPLDSDGNALWNSTPFNTERAPDGPGAGGTLVSWDYTLFDTDFYNITMTGACFVGGGGNVCDPDVNQDGNSDQGDVDYLVNVVAGGPNDTGIDPDFNQDGNVDQGDIDALINVVAGGMCP
ncbi:MAG: DVUA0089 family protein, partial [Gemmataceae bacterium]|nr:DVUA0089 family protein [Gemmataceae bacterium]